MLVDNSRLQTQRKVRVKMQNQDSEEAKQVVLTPQAKHEAENDMTTKFFKTYGDFQK